MKGGRHGVEPKRARAHPAGVSRTPAPSSPVPLLPMPLLLAVLLLTSGCARGCSEGEPARKGGEAAAADAAEQRAERTPASVVDGVTAKPIAPRAAAPAARDRYGERLAAQSRAGAYDVFVTIRAPALDARALDRALTPAHAAAAALPGGPQLWTMVEAGRARMLLRVARADSIASAERLAETALRAAKVMDLGEVQIAAAVRGARIRSALSLVADAGRAAATTFAETVVLPRAKGLPSIDRVGVAGASRAVADLHLLPPALARYAVGIGTVRESVQALLATSTGPLAQALEAIRVPRGDHPQGADGDPNLGDLVTLTPGMGEDLADAYSGKRPVTLVYATGAVDAADTNYSGAEQKALGRGLRPLLADAGIEAFLHTIVAMRRYRLVTQPGIEPEPLRALAGRIHAMLQAGTAHDALLLSGRDGVPPAVQTYDGRVATVWLAVAGARADEVALHDLRKLVEPGGWQVHALDTGNDTAIGWLLDEDATGGVVLAGSDPTATSAQSRSFLDRLAATQGATRLRSGPVPRQVDATLRGLDRDIARSAGVEPFDLALAVELLRGRFRMGVADGRTTHLVLPGGPMAARNGDLPLRAKEGLLPLQRLRKVADPAEENAILRIGGWPGLYVLADTDGVETWVFQERVRDAAQRTIESSSRRFARTLALEDARLSPPSEGR